MSPRRNRHSDWLPRATARLAMLALALLLAAPASAQTLTNSFGGLSENSSEPIDIESDVLVVHDSQKYATFKGNVKAVQGTTTLRAAELDVHYVGGADKLAGVGGKDDGGGGAEVTAPPATKVADAKDGAATERPDGTQISKIEARGEVVITSEDDQTTTSDWALYDVPAQLVTVGGNVVLSQGQNVLKGERLVIDLKTGESRFENTGNTVAGGRIRALFMPKQEAGDGKVKDEEAKPASSTPDSAEPGAGNSAGAAPAGAVPAGAEPEDGAAPSEAQAAGGVPAEAAEQTDAPKEQLPWQLVPGGKPGGTP